MILKQGVFVGENVELVVTKKYTLLFIIKKGVLMSFLLQSTNLHCIHAVLTAQEDYLRVEYLLTRQGGRNFVKGKEFFKYQEKSVADIIWNEDLQQYNIFFEYEVFVANVHEYLTQDNFTPKMIRADENTLAECLNQWHLGVYEIEEIKQNHVYFRGIAVNTLKHMFIFDAIEGGKIYIRAARYRCFNEGVAFNQNFRQFYDAIHPENAYHFTTNNNMIAMEEIEISKDYFLPTSCNLDQNTFYWSVNYYEPNIIRLNGCGGDCYCWTPGSPAH